MLRIRLIICFTALLLLAFSDDTTAQELDYQPKILLVTAHPDDDALFSATVFKTTHLLNGVVDLAIMTNGEGDIDIQRWGILFMTESSIKKKSDVIICRESESES